MPHIALRDKCSSYTWIELIPHPIGLVESRLASLAWNIARMERINLSMQTGELSSPSLLLKRVTTTFFP